jgi:plastocyanin
MRRNWLKVTALSQVKELCGLHRYLGGTKNKRISHMSTMIRALLGAAMIVAAGVAPASADDSYTINIGEQGFEPATLEVPAGQKIKLTVSNKTKKAAEFESEKLGREKVVPAGRSASISIGPLKAGSYEFINDFNKSHKGAINAK